MKRWSAVGVVAVLAATPLLAGCGTVPQGGVTGVGVTSTGAPVGVLAVCKGSIDRILLEAGEKNRGRWKSASPVITQAFLPLGAPTAGWSTLTPLAPLEVGRTYTLRGATSNDKWSTRPVDFSTETLAALRPGDVAFELVDDSGHQALATTTQAGFRANACANLDQ